MRLLLTIFSLLISFLASGQTEDTTVYKVMEVTPRFPGCEELDTTEAAINQCAQTALLMFFNRNIAYPAEARNDDIEGTVVLSFVVEKDGYISNPAVVKDIGGGCGGEALRVANGMNQALKDASLAWMPGKNGGKPVRAQMNVPIKFKLQEPPDFVVIGYDTVYVVLDDSLSFRSGEQALIATLAENLHYPVDYKDSCRVGAMDMTLRVDREGYVKIIDLADYWNLGWEFQWEAIKAASATYRQWNPAVRNGQTVPSSYDISVLFRPENGRCQQQIEDFDKANALAEEGSSLFNEGEKEKGIQKLSEAIDLFPGNANFLYLRGQAYLNMDLKDEACADFQKVRTTLFIGLVDQIIPLICK
jgi:TonB-like protein